MTILDPSVYTQVIRDRNPCDSMYKHLVHLSESPQPLGVFKISRAIYTWEEKFNDHPLYAQVIGLLFERGNEQESWCEPRTTEKPRTVTDRLELDFSKMRLNDREARQDTPDQHTENNESQSPTDTQGLDDNDNGEELQQEQKVDWNHVHERIEYAKGLCLVLRTSLFDLSRSLRISRLVFRLLYQSQLFETDEFKEERLDNMAREVETFIKASDELKALVEQ